MNKKTLFLILILGVLILPVISYAQGASGGGATTIKDILTTIATNLGGLGTALATIGFIVAGITYVASTTNPSLMSVAKVALIAAVVGVVIILLAVGACPFIKSFTGAPGTC